MEQLIRQLFGSQPALLEQIRGFLLGALLVVTALIAGWILGVLARVIFTRVFKHRVEDWSRRLGYKQLEQSLGLQVSLATLVGWFVQVTVTIVALLLMISVYYPTTVEALLLQSVGHLPAVVIALTLVLVGLFISQVLADLTYTAARAAKRSDAGILSNVVRIGVVLLAITAALIELGVATIFVTVVLVSLLATAGLGAGLALGLGSVDYVRDRLAGYTLRNQLRPGQRVTIEDISGVVIECGPRATLIATDDGRRTLIPNKEIARKTITLG